MDNTVDPQDIMASQDFQKDAFAPVSHEYDLALYQAEPTFSLSDLSFDGSHSAHDDTCCFDMPTANFGGYRRSAHDDLCLMTQPNLQSLHSHHVSHRGAPLPPSLRPHHPMSHYNCPQGSLYSSAVSMPVESFASVTALMDHDESSSGQNTGYHDADMGPSAGGNGVPESVADDLKSYTSLCDSDCMDSCGSECGPGEVCREDNCTNERSSWSLYDTSHDDMEAAFALTNVGSEGFLSTYVPARSIGRIVPHLIQMASPSRTSHANYKASLPTCKPTSLPGSRTPTVMSPFIFEHSVDCVHEKPHAPTKDSGPLDGTSETATSYTCLWCTNHPGGQQTCCNQAFPSEDALHTHWEEEHKPTTKKDGRLVGGSEQVGFWCDWKGCSRTEPFGQRTKLDRHVTCHTGYKAWNCPMCESKFSSKQGLDQHVNTHTAAAPYPCRYCEKRFKQPSARLMHERTHTGEKPLECHICGKRFSESSNLAKHRKTHNEYGEFVCDVQGCGKDFKRADQLRRHKVYYHKAGGEPTSAHARRSQQKIKRRSEASSASKEDLILSPTSVGTADGDKGFYS